jgi:gliding motility-associated-like protein
MKKFFTTFISLGILTLQAGYTNQPKDILLEGDPKKEHSVISQKISSEKGSNDNSILESENSFYIPNTFTPNNDGLNDFFLVYSAQVRSFKLEIFNRSGIKLFESVDQQNGWDGFYKGQPCSIATYVYIVELQITDGAVVKKIGHVNLIR